MPSVKSQFPNTNEQDGKRKYRTHRAFPTEITSTKKENYSSKISLSLLFNNHIAQKTVCDQVYKCLNDS